jgi:hypothetical protein
MEAELMLKSVNPRVARVSAGLLVASAIGAVPVAAQAAPTTATGTLTGVV